MEFPEEVLWIPGAKEALFANENYLQADNINFNNKLHRALKPIPYRGESFPASSRPNFFAASDYQIMSLAELTDVELDEVRQAKKDWYSEGVNLRESLPELYPRLARVFSFNESGVYRIRIQVSNENKSSTTRLEAILKLSRSLPRYRENTFSGLRFWRRTTF